MSSRLALALLLTVAAVPAPAATLVWPALVGPSPCNTTLQACIDLAAAGDTVQIGADEVLLPDPHTPINENLLITRSLVLTAAPGIDAVLQPGRNIVVTTSASVVSPAITISRVVLRQGEIRINHGASGTATTYTVNRVRMRDLTVTGCMMSISTAAGAGAAQAVFGENVLTVDAAGAPAQRPSAICASSDGPALRADIFRNRIETTSARLNRGIVINGAGVRQAFISENVVRGRGYSSGISVIAEGAVTPRRQIEIRSNFVRGQSVPFSAGEYGLLVRGNAIDVRVVNNTVIDNTRGIVLSGTAAGDIVGRSSSNIVAFNRQEGLFATSPGAASVVHESNLVHANGFDQFIAGPGNLAADPQFEARATGRPGPGSPAINSGLDADLPALTGFDAAGAPRRLGPQVDRGAFEFTDDRTAVHTVTASSAFANESTVLELGALLASETIIATPHHSATPDNRQNIGMYLSSAAPLTWAVFNQDNTVAMGVGRRFSMMAPLLGYSGFLHSSTPGNTFDEYTQLDHPELNARPFAIPLVTARYESAGGNNYHDHRIGLHFFSNRWYVRNEDLAAMQFARGFNVVIPPLGAPGAFIAGTNSTARFAQVLAHPYLDDNPCAAPLVSRGDDAGDAVSVANDVPFALEYTAGVNGVPGHWFARTIEASGANIPAGAVFHVVVDGNQALACNADAFFDDTLFRDGFE